MDLRGKNVLVFGAGISGIGAADLLKEVGANPVYCMMVMPIRMWMISERK